VEVWDDPAKEIESQVEVDRVAPTREDETAIYFVNTS
jgi:hypothetical protein